MEEGQILGLIFSLVFSAFGVVTIVVLRERAQWIRKSAQWKQTEGEIFTSWIKVTDGGESGDNYTPVIRYRYKVGQTDYVSTKVRFLEGSRGSEAEAKADVRKYPVDAKVIVSYDPNEPSDSVLDTSAPGATSYIIAAIVCFGLAVGAGVLVFV